MTPDPNPAEVEVVARAIYDAHEIELDQEWTEWDDLPIDWQTEWLEFADAAIQALDAHRADGKQPKCTGDYGCPSTAHVHGCFADTEGYCDEPDEHDRATVAKTDTHLADIARVKAEALREAADEIDALYFGPDQNTPFSTGAKHKWGATQAAKRLRDRANALEKGVSDE